MKDQKMIYLRPSLVMGQALSGFREIRTLKMLSRKLTKGFRILPYRKMIRDFPSFCSFRINGLKILAVRIFNTICSAKCEMIYLQNPGIHILHGGSNKNDSCGFL